MNYHGLRKKEPRKAAERAIALGEDDPFDYFLATELGWSHAQVQALSNDEYIRWRAYMKWRQVMRDHAAEVDRKRASRR